MLHIFVHLPVVVYLQKFPTVLGSSNIYLMLVNSDIKFGKIVI